MATFKAASARVELKLTLKITEEEGRALYAITQYGTEAFLEFFYKHLGQSCLKPHEDGLRLLFATIGNMRPLLDQAVKAREAFEGKKE